MKNKKIFLKISITIFLLIVISGFIYNTYGEDDKGLTCAKYSGKIEQCLASQDNPRSIEDFECINGDTTEITIQVILDEKFKKINEEIEEFIEGLEKSKDYYFGAKKKEEYIKGLNKIEKYLGKGGIYSKQYKKLCDREILSEAISCFDDKISTKVANDFLKNTQGKIDCGVLYQVILKNYRDAAVNTLKENKTQILHDEHKKLTQQFRDEKSKLEDEINASVGYLDDISNDVQSTTKHPH